MLLPYRRSVLILRKSYRMPFVLKILRIRRRRPVRVPILRYNRQAPRIARGLRKPEEGRLRRLQLPSEHSVLQYAVPDVRSLRKQVASQGDNPRTQEQRLLQLRHVPEVRKPPEVYRASRSSERSVLIPYSPGKRKCRTMRL